MDLKVEVKELFEDAFEADFVEKVFRNYVKTSDGGHERKMQICMARFQALHSRQPSEMQSEIVQILVKYIHSQTSAWRITFLFDFLELCIKSEVLPLKMVLDFLQCNELVYQKKQIWCKTYEVIRKFVHLVDYKGCRNLLHGMIIKIKDIPESTWNIARQQVDAISQTIEHVIDPESCLLPGYLAVNEIRQYMSEEQLNAPAPLHQKLIEFVDRFRATAAMVTTTGQWSLLPVVDVTFYQLTSTWKLDPETLRFNLKRQLPYCKEMYERQFQLVRYILQENYSRDMLLHVLGLQKEKQRCPALEVELASLLVECMARCPTSLMEELNASDAAKACRLLWQHLSSQVVYVVLYNLASFPHLVQSIYKELVERQHGGRDVRRGRDYLMWCLLQFISGSIQKNPISDFMPVVKLIHLVYPEREILPLPKYFPPSMALCFSAMCILTHLNKKVQGKTSGSEINEQQIQIPNALTKQHKFLKECLQISSSSLQNHQVAVVCNACSTTTDLFNTPIMMLVESVCGDIASAIMPGDACVAFNKTVPLPMELLDSLTAHTKMSMLHHIVGGKIQKLGQTNCPTALSPALAETYSRLLVYTEMESLGIKGLVTQLLPKMCECKSWGVVHMLIEMVGYRLHHIQPVCRIQLLSTLHNLANSQPPNHIQLHLGIENTALRLILGFDNYNIRLFSDQKQLVSEMSEELNRVLVLTLARSIHITGTEMISGSWCIDILEAVMKSTPHKWPEQTMNCFPANIHDFFSRQTVHSVDKNTLKGEIEEEFVKWGPILTYGMPVSSAVSETEAIKYFTLTTTSPYLVCLIFKVLLEGKTPSATAYKVLSATSAVHLSNQVRIFADFLVFEFSVTDGNHVKVCTDAILDIVWKYNIVHFDRLILCLALRPSEPDHLQVAFFIITYLLISGSEFLNRMRSFVHEVDTAEYWLMDDWHSHHMAFHHNYPELYQFEGLRKQCSDEEQLSGDPYLPTYFSNITLRLLSVLDILIHRFLEFSSKSLETLLGHLGALYKFHDHPITYLFNTLHYYERKLRENHSLKKKLVAAVIGAISEGKPAGWSMSADFMDHMFSSDESLAWVPSPGYYVSLVRRLVDNILHCVWPIKVLLCVCRHFYGGFLNAVVPIYGRKPSPLSPRDWRFNEFPNASSHALHVTCVEVLALPISPEEIGKALMDIVLVLNPNIKKGDMFAWMNAIALILTALPEVFWRPLHSVILSMISSAILKTETPRGFPYPYHLLTYSKQHSSYSDQQCTRLLALTHIVWHHMNIGQLSQVSRFLKTEVRPIVQTELQLLYVFHLIGPFFHRFRLERTRCMLDVATVLYDMLLQVSRSEIEIQYVDQIADFLYHVKYMHIGTAIRDKVEEVVAQLQAPIKKRLQFITHSPATGRQQAGFASNPNT